MIPIIVSQLTELQDNHEIVQDLDIFDAKKAFLSSKGILHRNHDLFMRQVFNNALTKASFMALGVGLHDGSLASFVMHYEQVYSRVRVASFERGEPIRLMDEGAFTDSFRRKPLMSPRQFTNQIANNLKNDDNSARSLKR
jgi:hypothetical protein